MAKALNFYYFRKARIATYLWRTRNKPHNIRVPVTRTHPAITKLQLFMPKCFMRKYNVKWSYVCQQRISKKVYNIRWYTVYLTYMYTRSCMPKIENTVVTSKKKKMNTIITSASKLGVQKGLTKSKKCQDQHDSSYYDKCQPPVSALCTHVHVIE